MTSVNNTTQTGNMGAYSSKGMSGLATGMNTDEIVEAMTSDIQAKIDKIKQQQQSYSWKQDAYREAISALIGFQDKYFSYSSSSNILSSSFFNCTSMVAGGSNAGKISMSGIASTTKPTYSVTGISQLATKASFSSGGNKTAGDITTGDITFGERDKSLVAGSSVSIKYGSSVYTVTVPSDMDITDADSFAAAMNKSMEGVNLESGGGTLGDKLKFVASTDGKMGLSTTSSGDSNSFSISGGNSEVLKALHMASGAQSIGGNITGTAPTTAAELNTKVPFSLKDKSLTFDLNGSSKTITFTADDDAAVQAAGGNIEALRQVMQDKIDEKFGAKKIRVNVPTNMDGTQQSKLSFETVKSDGLGGVVADDASTLKISSSTEDTLGKKGLFALDNGAKNRLDTAKTLKDMGFTPSGQDSDGKNEYKFKINGVEFTFKDDDSVSKVVSTINNDTNAAVNVTFLNTSGRFSVTADESGAQGKVQFEDVGGGDLVNGLFGSQADMAASMTTGQDMKMTIRYEGSSTDVEINRSSNAVSLDGINFTAKETFSAYDSGGVYNSANAINFTPKAETESIISTIKTMVDDYNKILDSVNTMTATKKNKNYPPLTDAQKKAMTSDEIKVWEDKAKEGILFGDSTLNQLASDLRFVFSAMVSNVGSAKDIGIKISSSYSDNGKITLDEKKLKEMLESDPEKVKAMFTSSEEASPGAKGSEHLEGGFAIRMKNIMESYAKSTGSKKGRLVDLAGLLNNATTSDNYIARQQKILSDNLTNLEKVLKKRQDRYQAQFTNLEVYVSKMNAQSSWLASATGG